MYRDWLHLLGSANALTLAFNLIDISLSPCPQLHC